MMVVGRVRTALGVETLIDKWAPPGALSHSLDLLASGSLWRMSRPLKLKAIGACLSAFELPDLGLLGLFAGAHRRRFSLRPD
jgi:hypothetical protein